MVAGGLVASQHPSAVPIISCFPLVLNQTHVNVASLARCCLRHGGRHYISEYLSTVAFVVEPPPLAVTDKTLCLFSDHHVVDIPLHHRVAANKPANLPSPEAIAEQWRDTNLRTRGFPLVDRFNATPTHGSAMAGPSPWVRP